MSNLWSGRFAGEPDKDVFEFGRSFPFDKRLVEDDITGSLAWAEAIRAAGVLSADEHAAIDGALTALLDAVRQDPRIVQGDDEDVHAWVERQLVERVGDAGKRLHTGRSRNEQVSVDLRLYLRRRLIAIDRLIVRVVAALVAQAEQAGDALMPAYTHLRRAQPVLAAHWFLSHAAAFRRDAERIAAVSREADALPLGLGRDRRQLLRHRRARAGGAPRVLARRRQQHGRGRRSRLRVVVPPRRVAVHGARQPARRGHHHLRQRGVRLHRSRRSRSRPAAA